MLISKEDLNSLCKNTLNINALDDNDDFFDKGADSLSIVEIQMSLEQDYEISVNWEDVFHCRTVSSLHSLISSKKIDKTNDSHSIEFENTKYSYRIIGDLRSNKTPKLILCGLFQDMYSLPYLEHLLKDDGPIIMIDFPGTGSADCVPEGRGFPFLAECIKHLINVLDISLVNLIGISYGGSVALELVSNYPEHINKLALIGVSTRYPEGVHKKVNIAKEKLLDGDIEQFTELTINSILCMDQSIDIPGRDSAYLF